MLSVVTRRATWLHRELQLQVMLGGLLYGLESCCLGQISVYSRVRRQAHAPRESAREARMVASVCRRAQGHEKQSRVAYG